MFIESSKDLLFVVLAFSILWVTIFLSWLLYYAMAIVRDTEHLVKQIRGAVEKVDELAHSAHEKMERSAASFTLVSQAIKELVVWGIQERTKKKVAKKTTSKRKKKE